MQKQGASAALGDSMQEMYEAMAHGSMTVQPGPRIEKGATTLDTALDPHFAGRLSSRRLGFADHGAPTSAAWPSSPRHPGEKRRSKAQSGRAVARQMVKQGNGGRIINISSVHEDLPMPGKAAYCASKGAIRMLMRTIAVELAPEGITVNNIGPGAIFTPIDADIEGEPELEMSLMEEIPLKRWGKPGEVASLALFLASEAAAYITGSTYFIDGGMRCRAGKY